MKQLIGGGSGSVGPAVPAGTAAAPSIAFEGDSNTGIYSPGADQVAISTNGTSRLVVDASGNVTSAGDLYANGTNGLVLFNGDPANYNISRSGGDLTFKGSASIVVRAGGGTFANGSVLSLSNSPYASFNVGGSERLRIDSSGRLLVGTTSDSGGALLQVNGDRIRIGTAKTPASATATGTTGEIAWDANYIYVCTATNTWKRTAIATW